MSRDQAGKGAPDRLARRTRVRKRAAWLTLGLLLLAAAVIAVGVGQVGIAPAKVVRAVLALIAGRPAATQADAIVRLRLPRIVLSMVVGAGLATSGAALQGLFKNPMADPYLLGISAGGALGAALAMALGLGVSALGLAPVPFFAFLGALAAAWVVYLLGRSGGRVHTETLLLSGVAMSALLSAVMSFLIVVSNREGVVNAIYFWMLGGFGQADWTRVVVAIPYAFLGTGLSWAYARDLNALLLGEESALHLGVDVERAKLVVLSGAALASAAAVSVSGIIGFVGLIAPHIVRLLQGPDHRALIPSAALVGALLLVVCDTLARAAFPPAEMPIGVLTAFTGVPFFLYLLRRARRIGGER